jgi:outer membrane receptor protein involved in Fe transport
LSIDYVHAIGGRLEARFTADAYAKSKYFLTPNLNPRAVQSTYAKFDLRAALGDSAERWEFAFLVRNVTDERVVSFANDVALAGGVFGAPGFFGFIDPPRTYSIQLALAY